MDPASEALMRSALHDLANCLSGVRGILELSDPEGPLRPRDRERLEAILEDGMTTLSRARHLATGTLPDDLMESGPEWREHLQNQLVILGRLFRCGFECDYEGDPAWDQWPGERLRSLVVALVRQLLPYRKEGPLHIRCRADQDHWSLCFSPLPGLPEGLSSVPSERPADLCTRWVHRLSQTLGASLIEVPPSDLCLRIPRR